MLNETLLSLILILSSIQKEVDKLPTPPAIVEENKNIEIQNAIMFCESRNNPKAINWDDAKITGYPSKGLYQWQPLSFLKYGLKYKILPRETKLKDVEKYIWRPEYNAAIAHAVIDAGETWNWKNCFEKYLALK